MTDPDSFTGNGIKCYETVGVGSCIYARLEFLLRAIANTAKQIAEPRLLGSELPSPSSLILSNFPPLRLFYLPLRLLRTVPRAAKGIAEPRLLGRELLTLDRFKLRNLLAGNLSPPLIERTFLRFLCLEQ
jgi:hypothetical protein